MPAWPSGDPRDVAHAILAAPPYSTVAAPVTAQPSLLELIGRWIGDRVGPWFAALGRFLGAEASHATLIGGLVVAALAIVVLVVVVRIVDAWVRRRSPRPTTPRQVTVAAVRRAEWLARAAAAAREERWRDAAAALVQAAFAALDESGRLPYDAARTPSEARRALGDPAFDGFARDADLALFASSSATAERYERMRTAFTAFAPRA